MLDRELKKIIRQWQNTPEGRQNCGKLVLKNAPNLLQIIKNSPHASRLLELATDCCQKSLRKDSGMFFTPAKATVFMVKNALKLWKQDHPSLDELKAIKILDPSCGGGEFLLAALDELFLLRKKFEPDIADNELVLSIINGNLFGIDCDKNAVELLIKRLESKADSQVKTCNFIHANTLQFNSAADFFNSTKFDIVIGNPPYVSYGLRNVNKLAADESKTLRARFPNSAEYKITLYALFMEFAVNSTQNGGIHSFIVPDSFLGGQYFTKLRNFLLKKCTFEHIILLKKNIFKAVPGNLVIYLVQCQKSTKKSTLQTFCLQDDIPEDLPVGHLMLQQEFLHNHRQRFRLFFDDFTHRKVKDMEATGVCRLGDLLELSSGVIGKNGKKSIIADSPEGSKYFRKGITSGKAVKSNQPVVWQNEYINLDPQLIKSGLGKVDYDSEKILIRQTGDRIIAAVDRQKLAVLNNLHVGISKKTQLDLDKLVQYLNSDELNFYYQAVTMEFARPMAQVDLETLRELPLSEDFCSK